MKKIFILSLLAILILVSVTHAQIQNGSIFLGGNIGFNTLHTQSEDNSVYNKQNGIIVSPVFGKAITNNLILGGDIGFGFSKNEQFNSGLLNNMKGYSYSAGVFLRQYKPIGKGFYIFLQDD